MDHVNFVLIKWDAHPYTEAHIFFFLDYWKQHDHQALPILWSLCSSSASVIKAKIGHTK